MTTYTTPTKAIFLLAILATLFFSCEKISVLGPPDMGDLEKVGTGNSDAKSILFVMNVKSSLFVDPASTETHIVSDEVLDFFTNDEFARPLDTESDKLNLDVLPILNSNDFMELQAPIGDFLEQSTYPGAFGTTVADEWHINSNWWKLDPQMIDYGYDPNNVVEISGRIRVNTTWTSNNKYLLKGQVFVEDGVTLTIEAGTIIFGDDAVGINAGVLCFNRGAKVMANGTPDAPIIFTSTAEPGRRSRGQWGGVLFMGRAPNNKGENVLIEGIQGPDPEDGLYGGDDINDSSGELSFWRVEYAGLAINPGNELNSITFGSAGNQTKVHHIIVSEAGDDSIEWFGGSANIKYVVSYSCLDDDLDMDSGYSGSVQYVYIVRNPWDADESGSACFEVSSSKTVDILPQTIAKVSNVTIVGSEYQLSDDHPIADPKFQGGMYSKEDAAVEMINSIIIGAPIGVQNP